jgi:SAM-dependent methyltransferase
MPRDNQDSYFWTGRVAVESIKKNQELWQLQEFSDILDMASGHGRVLRWFKYFYPNAKLFSCDLQKSARDFCESEFNSHPIKNHEELLDENFQNKFDLIWVGSLFTHLDLEEWETVLHSLNSCLKNGGVLAFTTHGDLVAQRLESRDSYGLTEEDRVGILKDYEANQFAFRRYPKETITNIDKANYGISISKPAFVLNFMTKLFDMRIIFVGEMKWANHQDLYLFIKKEINPLAPEFMTKLY